MKPLKKYCPTVVALVALWLTHIAVAQEDAGDSGNDMDEIEVQGYRTPTALGNVAGSVTVIDAEQIAEIQASSIDDIFANEPGVDVESDGRYGIRSINIRGLSGNYVKIKVDNVDQPAEFNNSSLITSGRVDMDVDMLKQVEVIRGPASSTQGSEAIGGSVLFSTIDPYDVLQGSGDGTNGWVKSDYHGLDNSTSINGVLANRTGAMESLLAVTQREGEERESFGDTSDQEYQRLNILGKLQFQVADNQRLGFTLESSETDTDATPFDDQGYDLYYYTEDVAERSRAGVSYEIASATGLFDSSVMQLDWQKKEEDAHTFRRSTGDPGEDKDYNYLEEGYFADLQFNKSIEGDSLEQRLAYGLTYKTVDHENTNITYYDDNQDGVFNDRSRQYFYMPAANSQTYGVYLQDELVLADGRLRVTPGVRYDNFSVSPEDPELDLGDTVIGHSASNRYDDYQDSAVTTRLGLVWNFAEATRFFAQYSQGFKSPDFRQLYYSWSNDLHGYKSEPNPDLEAEFSDSLELGLRGLGGFAQWELVAFYSDFEDFIDTESDFSDPAFPFGITRSVNIAEATIQGVEFNSRMELGDMGAPEGSSLRFAMAYADGETDDGEPLESVNPWSANLQLAYAAPNQPWGGSLRLNYAAAVDASDVVDPDTQYLPGSYVVADMNVYWQPLELLTVRAGVFNLTDEKTVRWSQVRGLAAADYDDRYTQPGRNWAVSARINF